MEEQGTSPESSSTQQTEYEVTSLAATSSISSSLCNELHSIATFNNQKNQGRMVSGPVHGGNLFLGDCHFHPQQPGQHPFTSSTTTSQSSAENWQQKLDKVRKSFKEMYLQRFRKTNPFSLPFTFDIENTWVSLALREDRNRSQPTEDHAELLRIAFAKEKMLIVEGNPATGKTSLMRRLAYEWAKGKQELSHFDLVIYAEFREVREKTFESIADLVIQFNKIYENFFESDELEDLKFLLSNKKKRHYEDQKILLLLDGYDESSLDKQCKEMSAYIASSALQSPLIFHVVLTARPGYLSKYRGNEGRYIFAKVLGFTTNKQKEKYIFNHFHSKVIDNKENIAAVHHLLDNNENLNKLAETPLFLTFICLVHERIVDGTLVELYCNIIWWLIDRHQQAFPDRDIPCSFGFQDGSDDKFETIQDYYLHFPQLHCLGNMALLKLKENVFTPAHFEQFNLQSIIEQVGLLRKEKKYDNSFKLATSFFFPHRTIQEFLAAFYCFCSSDVTNEWLLPNYKLDTADKSDSNLSGMNEFERFLLRIALASHIPIKTEKRKYYFERIADIKLDLTFDAFNTTDGFKLPSWFLSQCSNVQNITVKGNKNSAKGAGKMFNDTSTCNGTVFTSQMFNPKFFSFSDLMKLHSLYFQQCTFETNSHLTFTNCPSLINLNFSNCKMESSTNLGIATLPAIESLSLRQCKFEANSLQSITNFPCLKNLKFDRCEMESNAIFGIATLPKIDAVEFKECKISLTAWQSIIDAMSKNSVNYLKLSFRKDFDKEILIYLQKCITVEHMEITIGNYPMRQNNLLSFNDLKLHSLSFNQCKFEANSQLSVSNCSPLNILKFDSCEIQSNTDLGIATLPAINTVNFKKCKIDLATWQLITDAVRNSSVKYLKRSFGDDFNKEFFIHLQNCNNVEKMKITIWDNTFRQNDLLSFSDLIKLHSFTFRRATFEANSQLSFTNCPSLKILKFSTCEIGSGSDLGFATLPAIDTVQFYYCNIDLATWQSITEEIRNSSVKCLKLTADYFAKETFSEFLQHLQKCERIEEIHVRDSFDDDSDMKSDLILKRREEEVTANFVQTALKLPALTSIIILDLNGKRLNDEKRLKESNKERIEKAGQERNPNFLIKYVE